MQHSGEKAWTTGNVSLVKPTDAGDGGRKNKLTKKNLYNSNYLFIYFEYKFVNCKSLVMTPLLYVIGKLKKNVKRVSRILSTIDFI